MTEGTLVTWGKQYIRDHSHELYRWYRVLLKDMLNVSADHFGTALTNPLQSLKGLEDLEDELWLAAQALFPLARKRIVGVGGKHVARLAMLNSLGVRVWRQALSTEA